MKGDKMKKLIVMVVTAALIAGCAGNAAMMKKEMAANAIAGNVGRIVIYRPSAFAAGGAKNDILIDGELVTVLASGDIFYKDVKSGEYDIEAKNFTSPDQEIRVKLENKEVVYVKVYASMRTWWYGGWNIEQMKPARAINEIKALDE